MGFSLKKIGKSLGLSGSNIGGALGAGIGSMFGSSALGYSIGSSLGGATEAGFQQDMNEASAKKAFERNLYMWNLNNQYNDPSAQMARLKAAGLNPNLVYGSGSVVGNTSNSGYGDYGYNVYKPSKNQVVQEYQQLLANDANILNTQAETAVKRNAIYNNDRETTARIELMQAQAKQAEKNANILQYDEDYYRMLNDLFGVSGKSGSGAIGKIADFTARGGWKALGRGLLGLFRR